MYPKSLITPAGSEGSCGSALHRIKLSGRKGLHTHTTPLDGVDLTGHIHPRQTEEPVCSTGLSQSQGISLKGWLSFPIYSLVFYYIYPWCLLGYTQTPVRYATSIFISLHSISMPRFKVKPTDVHPILREVPVQFRPHPICIFILRPSSYHICIRHFILRSW